MSHDPTSQARETKSQSSNGRDEPKKYAPRKEARILAQKELTADQHEAAHQTHGLLLALAEQEPKEKKRKLPRFLPDIDEERMSQIVLIDGGRGSGKTALLVTLIDHWNRSVEGLHEDDKDKKERVKLSDRQSIVPVGLLDMYPLPAQTQLLLYVVSRLFRVAETLERKGKGKGGLHEPEEPPPWRALEDESLRSTKAWRRFLRVAVAGWNRDVQQRNARLDLDAYTVEIDQTERERLDVRSCFAAFVNALVEDYKRIRCLRTPPLFVIAIDDADMNPHLSRELLNLLRLLYHPRVAFLLAGDSELFLNTLTYNFLGDFLKPLSGVSANLKQLGIHARAEKAALLARQFYDRLIPPGHRCALLPLRPSERLECLGGALKAALKQIPLGLPDQQGTPGWNLGSYFLVQDDQIVEALPDRLRGLINFYEYVYETIPRVPQEESRRYLPAARVVEKLWKDALADSLFFGDRTDWEDTIVADETTGEFVVRVPDDFKVSHRGTRWFGEMESTKKKNKLEYKILFKTITRFVPKRGEGPRISQRMLATLMLAASVAIGHPQGLIAFEGDGKESLPSLAVVEWKLPDTDKLFEFDWPLPDWRTFPRFAVFASRWSRVLARYSNNRSKLSLEHTEELAKSFLTIILQLGDPLSGPNVKPLEWDSLATKVADLATADGAHDDPHGRKAWALGRAGLLAAPESGLVKKDADTWLQALKVAFPEKRWEEAKIRLRSEREKRLRKAVGEEFNRFLSKLKQARPSHQWNHEFTQEQVSKEQKGS